MAAGLGDRWVEIRVPRVGGVAGEDSVGLCLLGRMRPLLEYSERERLLEYSERGASGSTVQHLGHLTDIFYSEASIIRR